MNCLKNPKARVNVMDKLQLVRSILFDMEFKLTGKQRKSIVRAQHAISRVYNDVLNSSKPVE